MITARLGAAPIAQDVTPATNRGDLCLVARLERYVLPSKQEAGGTVGALDGANPGDRGLDRVARAPQLEIGDQPQGSSVLDRLMRGTVFTKSDGIVRVDKDAAQFHQRGQAHRVASVV